MKNYWFIANYQITLSKTTWKENEKIKSQFLNESSLLATSEKS